MAEAAAAAARYWEKEAMERSNPIARAGPVALALIAWGLLGATCGGLGFARQSTFDSPAAAGEALIQAVEAHDPDALMSVLGPEYRDAVVTTDWDAARASNLEIAEAARASLLFEEQDDGSTELVIGERQWPFPIRLVKEGGSWRFDTASGIDEILDRRIGRNELVAIAIARAYRDAQIEYARRDRNGDGMLEYAQKLVSSPGERDGLYWEIEDGAPPSPFGSLVESSRAYLETKQAGDAVRGYRFQILTRQGKNAPGGHYDYVVGGRMISG
ncbi:MAG: DUF2950 family protein, partial [bacterium]